MEEYITPETIASEVMMQMAAHKGQFLLVEGSDDVKLFGKFVDKVFCMTIDARGRPNVLGAIECLLSRGVHKAVGIVDDDFDSLIAPIDRANICITDENDAEMMLICSEAFDSFLDERLDSSKWKAFKAGRQGDVRELIFEIGASLGSFRAVSKRKSLNIDFKTISWSFINQSTLDFSIQKLAHSIYGANKTILLLQGITLQQLVVMATEETSKATYKCKLCRGHDITKIIGVALKDKLGSNNSELMKSGEVEAGLRMSYHWVMFKETKLCRDVRAWEKEHGRVFRFDA